MMNLIAPNSDYNTALNAGKEVVQAFIFALNEVVDSYMVDAYSQLRKSPFFKQKLKMEANLARKSMEKCLSAAHSHIKKNAKEFYYSYVDNYTEMFQKDINILYYTILQELTKVDAEHRQLLATIEITNCLLNIACCYFDDAFDIIRRVCNYDVRGAFLDYKPIGAYNHWIDVERLVISMPFAKDINIDLNRCKDVRLAVQVLMQKMSDLTSIEKSDQMACEELGIELPDEN